MPYNVQQRDIDIVLNHDKIIYTKVELLNKDFIVIDEFQGETIDANMSIDAESDIRRTYSSTLFLKDKSYTVGVDKKIWLDKYIRPYIGFLYSRTQEVIYYPLGVFLFNDNNFTYNETEMTLQVSCLDSMCNLNGVRNGQLPSQLNQVAVGSSIRDAMISTVSQLGLFKKYMIEDIGKPVPYDLKFTGKTTVYEIIKELRDLYPAWETFFDIEGIFVCQEIPNTIDDNIVLDKETMKQLVKSENINNSFSEVKNKTEVYGMAINADRFTDISTNTGSEYNITLDNFTLSSGTKIAFKPNINNLASPSLKINSLSAYGIYDENEQYIPVGRLKTNTTYVVRFKNNKYYLLGQWQTRGLSVDANPQSPYYIGENEENMIYQRLDDGDFAKIPTDDLCQQRADYENWKSTRMTDSVNLEMLIIPWLEVNQKVEYTSLTTGETFEYIIKKINYSLMSGLMTVEMIKFYPLYPFIVQK